MNIKFTIKKALLGLNLTRVSQLSRERSKSVIDVGVAFQPSDFSSIFFSNNLTNKDFKEHLRGRGIFARRSRLHTFCVF